jgi:superfamily II DNA or RNA helicase
MRIPYVIDNQVYRLADVLNALLKEHKGRSLDVASAYFTVGGFGLLKDGLSDLGSFRLLLGADPVSGEQLGLRPAADLVKGLVQKDINDLPFDAEMLKLVEDLIAYLRLPHVSIRLYKEGFLHAKCWLFYKDRPQGSWDRFQPTVGIVGSSNFTVPGLTSNRELNLSHKTLLSGEEVLDDLKSPPEAPEPAAVKTGKEEDASGGVADGTSAKELEELRAVKSAVGARAIADLDRWFEAHWQEAKDFKKALIELLDASKFGRKEYTPYQVYMKALFEYFKDDLAPQGPQETRTAVELTEFQEDAVKKARKILSKYDGVMIADSVGLGKTWIGKKLLEDFAYHMRQKALIVCPASLRDMWRQELLEAAIAVEILSQEELGREEFDPSRYADSDIVLIDESHNFRNRSAQRYGNMERLLGSNGGRGRDGFRKKVILLTATPINNDLFDLYNQISLISLQDRSYFSACGIGDVYRYFLKARRGAGRIGSGQGNGIGMVQGAFSLFNLLEEIVIRRTRPFIRKAYPETTIRGKRITFPERRLKTIQYNLEEAYSGIYNDAVLGIESLKLAPYDLESYKKAGAEVDEFEAGRGQALVGIFKSRYLKRFESSIDAFRVSVSRALQFLKTFESYFLDGRLMRSSEFHKAVRYVESEDEEDDATPRSLADEIEASEEAKDVLDAMEEVDMADYDLRKLHEAVQHDVEVLSRIWQRVKDIGPENDAKLGRLKQLLLNDLRGKKVLIFSYYKDTARYLYRHLGHPDNPAATAFRVQLGNVAIRRMDSGADPKERARIIQGFSPRSNKKPEWIGTDKEIDILISTDVLSEGQNLQDCGFLINYDLHWNPTRMVQRAGRIDRIGTEFEELRIYNMFPDRGLEQLLHLVESLSRKIEGIDRAGFLDASVLGEVVHPRNFNTLRRIQEEDGTVIEEEEQFAELASSEFLKQQLKALLDSGGKEMLESLPDGIHSGLVKPRARGVFFYFQAVDPKGDKHRFWKYLDLKEAKITDNRYLIANLIACEKDRPRVVDPEIFNSIFDHQERVVGDILRSFEEQRALQTTPRQIDPLQQTAVTVIQTYLNHPEVERPRAVTAIRFLNQPMLTFQVKRLRSVYETFQKDKNIGTLLGAIETMAEEVGNGPEERKSREPALSLGRSDLRLICFDIVSG